jgi:outer membrane protein OmpA-like peptidoglycan-associated protein
MKKIILTVLLFYVFSSIIAQEQTVIYFDSNKFDISKSENKKLQDWITQNPKVKIVAINGYTDEVGTSGYNDTLAKRRVDCVLSLLTNKIQIRSDFKSRSFGENFQQAKNKAENRKVTIYYLLEKDLVREDEILGIKKTDTIIEKPKKVFKYPNELSIENPDGTLTDYTLNVDFMKQVAEAKTGEKLKIENLNFVINTFAIVNESRGKLYELLLVMQRNPKLKIEIQGHLCCMTKDRADLSTQRAKAVSSFLRQKGIDSARITYKGFGVSDPIFAIPEKNEGERAANRRVEILIIEN